MYTSYTYHIHMHTWHIHVYPSPSPIRSSYTPHTLPYASHTRYVTTATCIHSIRVAYTSIRGIHAKYQRMSSRRLDMLHTCRIRLAYAHHTSYAKDGVCIRTSTLASISPCVESMRLSFLPCTRTVYAHVCRTYARCMRLSIRMRVVCGTYV